MRSPRLADLAKAAKPKPLRMSKMRADPGIRIAFIPDLQHFPGAPVDHLRWIGAWIKDRKPAVVVQAGDFVEMGSCSSYDAPGSLEAEGRSIAADLACCRAALAVLGNAMGGHRCRKIVTLGNHENRLARYVNDHPEHRDTYAHDPFGFEAAGWETQPFLEPIEVAGITFVHFTPRSASGRVTQTRNGAPNALTMVKREMRSCVAGHAQGLDTACLTVGGKMLRGIIAGSAYPWEEEYMGAQGRDYWRGVIELNEAADGYADVCEVSLSFLCRRYGGGRWPK